ncbi:MAG: DUF748 domain-containing protein, partial [Verrucomicrobia bacterium]|nr:DUF748 domain-containing protein [Verrucomicrobiota bacterium]
DLVLAPIHFRIENFHTKQDADNRYAFSARTREEEEINLEGVLRLDPLSVEGDFSANAFKLPEYSLFAEEISDARIHDGTLSFHFPFSAQILADPFALDIDGARVMLEGAHATMRGKRDADFTLSNLLIGDIVVGVSVPESGELSLEAAARIELDGFDGRMDGAESPFATFASLRLEELVFTMAPMSLQAGEIVWTRPEAIIRRDAEGELELLQLLPPADSEDADLPEETIEEVGEALPAGTEAEDMPSGPPLDLRIASFRLEEGKIRFQDASVSPAADLRMEPVHVDLAPVTLDPETPSKLKLESTILGQGTVSLDGELRLVDLEKATSALLKIEQLPMTELSPYTVMALGQPVEQGAFTGEVDLSIEEQRLVAENLLTVDQLRFGPVAEGFEGKTYPVGTAIAVMENGKGLIELDIPVSGSLADPAFDPSKVVATAIRNLFLKAITAPFNLAVNMTGGMLSGLTSMASGGGEDLADFSKVSFQPGTTQPLDEAAQVFPAVANMLEQRPNLRLTLRGAYHPRKDRQALLDRQFEETLSGYQGESRAARIRAAFGDEFVPEVEPEPSPKEVQTEVPAEDPAEDPVEDPPPAEAAPREATFYLADEEAPSQERQIRSFYLSSSRKLPLMRRMVRTSGPSAETPPEQAGETAEESEEPGPSSDAVALEEPEETAEKEDSRESAEPVDVEASPQSAQEPEPTIAEMEERLREKWLREEPDLGQLALERARTARRLLLGNHGAPAERIEVSDTAESSESMVHFTIESTLDPGDS